MLRRELRVQEILSSMELVGRPVTTRRGASTRSGSCTCTRCTCKRTHATDTCYTPRATCCVQVGMPIDPQRLMQHTEAIRRRCTLLAITPVTRNP